MAGGLAALLDDIAALARLAAAGADDVAAASAKAGSKALGVVIDDAAVTPQYVQGITPNRELPIIWRITKGSLRNKLIFILPLLLLLSVFAPWLLTPILMLGGLYLSFEGAEKIWELVRGKPKAAPASSKGAGAEDKVVSGAVRTDLILSAEIMVISMNAVDTDDLWMRAAVLVVIAIGITALVYGAVALIVKMDDVGLALTKRDSPGSQKLGHGLVAAMPRVLDVLAFIGTFAMLWVGGHILLVGLADLSVTLPYDLVHALEAPLTGIAVVGGLLAWLVNTLCSMILGFLIGSLVLGVISLTPLGSKGH